MTDHTDCNADDRFPWDPEDDPILDLLDGPGTYYALTGLIIPPASPTADVVVKISDRLELHYPADSTPYLDYVRRLRNAEALSEWLDRSGAPADATALLAGQGKLVQVIVDEEATSIVFPPGIHLASTCEVWAGSGGDACLTPYRALNTEVYAAGNTIAQLLFDRVDGEDLNAAIIRVAAEEKSNVQVVCRQIAIHLPALLAGEYAYFHQVTPRRTLRGRLTRFLAGR